VREATRVKDPEISWWAFIRRAKSPELPVVLCEDAGALIGLVIALAAITMAEVTGDATWDGVGTLLIGLLLIAIALMLAVEMKGLLIGESAAPEDLRRIETAITGQTTVTRLIHLRTQHIGPEELLVAAKIEFDRDLDMEGLAAAVNGVEQAVRADVPTARLMFLEPDIARMADPGGSGATAPTPV
jgi:divalent metal cation (Fe/Co/Zn/Cd) transporter